MVSLTWNVGTDVETWAVSPRGAGWLFGDKVATEVYAPFLLCVLSNANMIPTSSTM